ncbi:MAG: methyltransferase domain-containing protein [bacterium]|nr:methyltransferase domain-containing protein [bacterium]
MNPVDFGRHSDDYAEHRPGFPDSFYRRIDAFMPVRGARALDLATGPGIMALELAARGAAVAGIDVAPEQIAAAERLAQVRDLADATRFHVARAEETGFDNESFDLVTAGQCWHWFDGEAAMAEALRVLRPAGILVIAHYSYLAQHSPVARDTEELVLRFNPSWNMAGESGVYPQRIDDAIRGGFERVEAFCYQQDERFSHAAWRGRMRTCNGVGSGGLSPEEVPRFDEALGRLLAEKYPDPVDVEHRVWCVVARKPL